MLAVPEPILVQPLLSVTDTILYAVVVLGLTVTGLPVDTSFPLAFKVTTTAPGL